MDRQVPSSVPTWTSGHRSSCAGRTVGLGSQTKRRRSSRASRRRSDTPLLRTKGGRDCPERMPHGRVHSPRDPACLRENHLQPTRQVGLRIAHRRPSSSIRQDPSTRRPQQRRTILSSAGFSRCPAAIGVFSVSLTIDEVINQPFRGQTGALSFSLQASAARNLYLFPASPGGAAPHEGLLGNSIGNDSLEEGCTSSSGTQPTSVLRTGIPLFPKLICWRRFEEHDYEGRK